MNTTLRKVILSLAVGLTFPVSAVWGQAGTSLADGMRFAPKNETPSSVSPKVTKPEDTLPPGKKTSVTAADLAWAALKTEQANAAQLRVQGRADAESIRQAKQTRAGSQKQLADAARKFFTDNPGHEAAAEARTVEIFSLIQAVEDGDDAMTGRLDAATDELRRQTGLPVKERARGVAAHDFAQALRGVATMDGKMIETERVARSLLKDFPSEPQGYEALWAVGRASPGEKADTIARELVDSVAPVELRQSAQLWLARSGLVGRSLAGVLGANKDAAFGQMRAGVPMIIYSWAAWGPQSIELGRMLQARRFAAIGVCLDQDVGAARALASAETLGTEQIYDPAGLKGATAAVLKFSTAGQVYLVDETGIIRDVRGGENMERKLKALGIFSGIPKPASAR